MMTFIMPAAPQTGNQPAIIVNKKVHQLAFIQGNKVQKVYKAATGKSQELTPEGLFKVTVKAKNPYYRKKNIPGGDPRNPLGSRWIGFNAKGTDGRTYGVHGTNRPGQIGTSVSQGCIRLTNKNVEQLFEKVPIGTQILVVNSPKSFLQLAKQYKFVK
ncbi:L,D-transpeptidase [Peribacillus deserti]|uniref:L,D-transpeptidase n=1 Tax=Peribacillus deserti TaxID=673318 RepID=A0A2N5M0H3_9BACI|nr:L,D-transpeptidase [Peribacillus deserti]PLT27874.1 L,D-transpeptidase [Peribacillus deserti]